MLLKSLMSLVVTLVLTSCASTVKYGEPSFAEGVSKEAATLHVLRPNSAWGSAIRTPVYINNQLVGRIGPGGHLETKIPVGRISVSVTTSDVIINAENNAEYFVKVTMPVQLWFMTPSFGIELINMAEGKSLMESNQK